VTDADDQTVRRRALAPEESFIVQAPAGSGKTELLIQRCLALLGRVRQPEEIVAITFTRKAAAEMRERVLDALRHAATGARSDDPVAAQRHALAREAMANNDRQGWELTDNPSRLQIQTIDSLCLSLARQLPVLSGFVAPAGILDDQGATYRRAALQALQQLGGSNEPWNRVIRVFLMHLDNNVERAMDLIAAMLGSRDQWLRHLGGDSLAPGSLEAAWRRVIESWLCRASERLPGDVAEDLVQSADQAASQLAGGEADASDAAAWLAGEGLPAPRAEELGRWRFLAGILFVSLSNYFRVLQPQIIREALDLVVENINLFNLLEGFQMQEDIFLSLSRNLLFFGALVLFFALLMGLFMFFMRQTIIVMSRLIEYDIRKKIFGHYQDLDLAFYKRNNTGDLMSRITEDVSKVRMYLGPAVLYGINLVSLFVMVIYSMLSVSPLLTLYCLAPLPLLSISIYYVSNLINKKSERIQRQLASLNSTAQEVYSGIRVVKSYVQEMPMIRHFTRESDVYKGEALGLARVNALFFPLMLLLIGIVPAYGTLVNAIPRVRLLDTTLGAVAASAA